MQVYKNCFHRRGSLCVVRGEGVLEQGPFLGLIYGNY